jgi:hypothetical protein
VLDKDGSFVEQLIRYAEDELADLKHRLLSEENGLQACV